MAIFFPGAILTAAEITAATEAPSGDPDWLTTGSAYQLSWPVTGAQGYILSENGQIALTVGSRAKDLSSGYGSLQTTIGLAHFAFNDDVFATSGRHVTVYAGYFEAQTLSGASGLAFAAEMDAVNFASVATPPTPGTPIVYGSTVALWLASGGSHTSVNDASMALGIKDNGARFQAGIVFGANALTMSGGFGSAIKMAKGHLLQWHDASDAVGSSVGSTVATAANAQYLQFQDGGLVVGSAATGNALFTVQQIANAVNGLAVQPAVSGGGGQLLAVGSDTNININLIPKGSGVIYTPAGISVNGPASLNGAVGGTGIANLFAAPYAIGETTANTGAFTSLSATSTVVTGNPTLSTAYPAQGGGASILSLAEVLATTAQGAETTAGSVAHAEFGMAVRMTSNTGKGSAANLSSNKVGLYVEIDVGSNSGNAWAFNPVLNLQSGAAVWGQTQIAEFDLANGTGTAFGNGVHSAGIYQPAVFGMQITGVGSNVTGAIGLLGSIWNRGIIAYPGSVKQSLVEDYSSATTSYYDAGTHTYGIDTKDATYSAATVRLGAQQIIAWRNQAGTSDLNMLQSTGTDDLLIGTGAHSVIFNLTGNVGIGTTTPSATLDVLGSTHLGDGVTRLSVYADNAHGGISVEASNYANTTKKNIYLAAYGGNVGIGTTSPSQLLTVNGTVGASALNTSLVTGSSITLQSTYSSSTVGQDAAQLLILSNSANYGASTVSYSTSDNRIFSVSANTSTQVLLRASSTAQMAFTAQNFQFEAAVGIGVSSPAQALEVSSSTPVQLRLGAGATSELLTYDIGRYGVTGYLTFTGNQGSNVGYVFNGNSNTPVLTVDSNANIYGTGGTTSMTNGFIYVPAASGPPTGTPSSVSGHVPMYFDAANNNFYLFNSSWKKVGVA